MTLEQLRSGKLEQMCSDCGRWEAASTWCSWCSGPINPTDWYGNGDQAERTRRLPSKAPADPPAEYRRAYRPEYGDGWPPAWGPNPYKAAGQRGSHQTASGSQSADRSATTAAA